MASHEFIVKCNSKLCSVVKNATQQRRGFQHRVELKSLGPVPGLLAAFSQWPVLLGVKLEESLKSLTLDVCAHSHKASEKHKTDHVISSS